jgi:hypothetical protein
MFCHGFTQNGVYTIGGSHLNTISSPRMKTMPSQNDGVARPAMAKIRTA